ncbi:purine and uridine phosphorylase [Aspergillus carlsbadensis]|nr:purine and uridine phosphorylase [Aspergillus carlsbadensis]
MPTKGEIFLFTHGDYTVGWVCPLEVELIAALEMLDEEHERLPQQPADHNVYHLGSIAGHRIVIAGLAQAGNCVAATVVAQMRLTFPNIRFGLLVGIGGGVPVMTEEGMLRLGHVVVSKPVGLYSGVIQYDRGKAEVGKFVRTGALAPPPPVLLVAAQSLAAERARSLDDPLLENIRRIDTDLLGLRRYRFPGAQNDFLFPASYPHSLRGASCEESKCSPEKRITRDETQSPHIAVHRGTIASADLVLKDGSKRDLLGQEYGVLCFEMEAAGALSDFPCMVIRGISDYCDSHKNDQWHGFAAAAAAAYASPGVRRMVQRSDDHERQEIADWISSTNYAALQADYLKRREIGTSTWLLETTEFREWKAKKGVLYCPGIPGAGKTVFSAVIIDHLQEIKAADESIGLAYVFCNYRQQQIQKLDDLLASILRQLVQSLPVIPDDLRALYQGRRNDGSKLHHNDMCRFIESVCHVYSQVYLVVDALDECLQSDRDGVISYLIDLQQRCNLSLLTTSRDIPEITARFELFPAVEIRASVVDVRRLVLGHGHEVSNCVRRNANLSKLIVDGIVKSARGMFLLAKLHLDSLRGKSSPRSVKLALGKLQNGSDAYDSAYQEVMKRIEGQTADQAHLAKQLLAWLTCALRPLTLTELQYALDIVIGETSFDDENLPEIEDMISALIYATFA